MAPSLAPSLGNLSLNYDLLVFISIKKLFKTWLKSMTDDYSEFSVKIITEKAQKGTCVYLWSQFENICI